MPGWTFKTHSPYLSLYHAALSFLPGSPMLNYFWLQPTAPYYEFTICHQPNLYFENPFWCNIDVLYLEDSEWKELGIL